MYEVFDSATGDLLGSYASEREALAYAVSYQGLNAGLVEVNVLRRSETGVRSVVFTDQQIAAAVQWREGVVISSNAFSAPTVADSPRREQGTAGIPSTLVSA